jgi:YesN/AraC family two-component response regulator
MGISGGDMATILIIDNDEGTRELFCFVLSPTHNILEAANGQEGLRLYKEHYPDIIITDLSIPRVAGIDFVKSVRELSRQVTIIACSGYFSFCHNREEMIEAGADICLQSPIECSLLEQTIHSIATH